MRIKIIGLSDPGRVREHNEDCIASDESLGLVVLADGMGGCQAGEVASTMAVNTILQELKGIIKTLFHNQLYIKQHYHYATIRLEQAILKANQVIYEAAEQHSRYHGMGTTIVAALFSKHFVSIAHVGDSRLYRLRGDEFRQLTKDHTVVQDLIDAGILKPNQARYDSRRHWVTRALGIDKQVKVDIQEQNTSTQDLYLFCSDGLSDMLDDTEIQVLLQESNRSLESSARLLIETANKKGGDDNISLLLVRPLPLQKNWLQRLFRS
jgi:protein phosphatase